MERNVIPRKFKEIIARFEREGDIYSITKDEYDGYIGVNSRTNKKYRIIVDMLRIKELVTILEIIK